MAEQIWVWPLYPHNNPKNRQVPESDVEAGQTIDVTVGQVPEVSNIFTGRVLKSRNVWHRYYPPTEADLAGIKRHYCDVEPGNPSWPRIEADLIVARHERGNLAKLNAPTLLGLLEAARRQSADESSDAIARLPVDNARGSESHQTRPKRVGRPRRHDRKEDKRIAEAWSTGHYTTHADLEQELGLSEGTAKRALDRHRKRK